MCDFHSVVVRRDGVIAHVRENSHSKAVASAGWTENTSAHLPKRFVEVEWNGEGEYPGACQITRYCGNDDLTEKQRKTIDRHYGALALAMKGDASALQYFDDLGPDYQDVLDQVISRAKIEDMPKLMAKLFCDSDVINKRVKEGITRGDKGIAEGEKAQASVSGDSGKASVSGDSGQASVSGNYGKASVSGYEGKASVSGNYGKASVSGEKGLAAVIGNGGQAKAEKNGCIVLTYWDKADRPRVAVGYVGEDGIEADTWYVVKEGKLVKV